MYTSLQDAPVNEDLTVLDVTDSHLNAWLQRLGIFTGGHLIKHDEEINYHPVRIRAELGEIVIPAGLAIKIFIHTDDDVKKTLVEMERGETGHVEAMTCGRGCVNALSRFGLTEGAEFTFVRRLPHMDYITVIDRRERTRLSEGEAARIWGKTEGQEATQFYFAKRNKPFMVQEIIGGQKITRHLITHGITVGAEIMLESIAQTQEIHAPSMEHLTVSSPGGLRMYLTPFQAAQIIVKTTARTEADLQVVSGQEL